MSITGKHCPNKVGCVTSLKILGDAFSDNIRLQQDKPINEGDRFDRVKGPATSFSSGVWSRSPTQRWIGV